MRVYLMSSVQYSYLHHRFQQMANQFRAMGIPVTYIEQTYGWRAYLSGARKGLISGVASSVCYHARALLQMVFPPLRPRQNIQATSSSALPRFENIEMPLVIPTNRFDCACLEKLNTAVFRQVLRRRVFGRMEKEEESIAIVDNPLWGLALERNDFTRVYYDCIDDVSLYAGRASLSRFFQYELRLIELSDAMFVTAKKLEDRLRSLPVSKPMFRIPNGVDVDWFEERAAEFASPADISAVRKPIVGYAGTISEWLDYRLIEETARQFSDVSFVFIGPIDYEKRRVQLQSSNNVYWLGKKEYREVPAYIAAFNVCWIPFSSGRIVENTNPIKLFEYFALGKPVVTTPMTEVEPYRDSSLVYVGDTTESLMQALRHAITEDDSPKRAERVAVARAHSWNTLIGNMRAIVCGEDR